MHIYIMKKTFLYLFSAFLLGINLSSCLDDTGASTSGSNYAVIHSNEGTPSMFAWVVGNLPLTWSGISSEFNSGDLVYLSYDVDLNSVNNGVVTTDKTNIQVIESYPVQDQKRITIGEGVADTSAITNNYKFESLNLGPYYPYKEPFKDRWVFTARVKLKDGQVMEPLFFYDTKEGMQHTSTGADLPENVIILDVKLNIKGEGDGSEKLQDKTFVTDFSQLRSQLFLNATEQQTISVWLRYYDSSKSQDKPTYVQNVGGLIHTVSSTNN